MAKFDTKGLTYETAAYWLVYDAHEGIVRWRLSPNSRAPAGSVAGFLSKGYRRIGLLGRLHYAHNIAWLLHTGAWPKATLDHRDENGLNNRFGNLRECIGCIVNQQNVKAARRDNTSGFRGVSFKKKSSRWTAKIWIDGKAVHLGYFDDPKIASNAYASAKARLHPASQ